VFDGRRRPASLRQGAKKLTLCVTSDGTSLDRFVAAQFEGDAQLLGRVAGPAEGTLQAPARPRSCLTQDEGLPQHLGDGHALSLAPGVIGWNNQHEPVAGKGAEDDMGTIGLPADDTQVGFTAFELLQHR
jgi:hypothetical protein